jgi:surface protein
MFANAVSFNNGGVNSIQNWNVGNVTDMSGMFGGARAFNQPLSGWERSTP